MNVVLTAKDADSIISYLREELTNLTTYQNHCASEFKSLSDEFNQSEKLKKSKRCRNLYQETTELYNDRMKSLNEESSKLVHFIELLTCGSGVTE